MNTAKDFILNYEGPQKVVLNYFHNVFTTELDLIDKIKYKIPFYYHKSWICYLNPKKDGGVELAFTRGNELSNEQGLLKSEGRKQIQGIIFYQLSDIPERAIREILQEAIILDQTVRYASKRSQ